MKYFKGAQHKKVCEPQDSRINFKKNTCLVHISLSFKNYYFFQKSGEGVYQAPCNVMIGACSSLPYSAHAVGLITATYRSLGWRGDCWLPCAAVWWQGLQVDTGNTR
jgi:hypothetical protein